MTSALDVLKEALELSAEEKEELIGALSRSLDPVEVSDEWVVELEQRAGRIARGEAVMHDAEAHLAELKAKYGAD